MITLQGAQVPKVREGGSTFCRIQGANLGLGKRPLAGQKKLELGEDYIGFSEHKGITWPMLGLCWLKLGFRSLLEATPQWHLAPGALDPGHFGSSIGQACKMPIILRNL